MPKTVLLYSLFTAILSLRFMPVDQQYQWRNNHQMAKVFAKL